ncbi:methionine--tRNA ligase [Candidatus Parcubacteria bacterium]|nr:methionine--tRNA ligase [Candidatus Parcubacteria bacterium]
MSKDKFYITTPIYYVNDTPHIGHACTTLAADCLNRCHQLKGEETFFLAGTDEHGAKVAEAAVKAGQEPQQFTDEISQRFVEAWKLLNVDYNFFIRTTNPDHIQLAREFFQRLYDQGDIYKGRYEGLYCVGCEKFITEKELIAGKCPLHDRVPEKQSEENYFFKLTKFAPQVRQLITSGEFKVSPENKKNEILNKIDAGVEDLSISRANVPWGIPVPWDEKQTIYVWVEALLNYWTAPQIVGQELWPANLHLIGKEIAWFHCLIWPALLLAAGEELPREIFVHDFYGIKGIKMSKSLGNVITPQALVDRFGTDGARYLLLAFFPHSTDTALSWELMEEKYTADLANGLGNLVQRVAKLCERLEFDQPLASVNFWNQENPTGQLLNDYRFGETLTGIWQKIKKLDQTINTQKPWEKSDTALEKILTPLVGGILEVASALKPFIPETADQIEKIFTGKKIKAGRPLFPRVKPDKS